MLDILGRWSERLIGIIKADAGSSNSEMESLLAELGKMGEGGEGDEDLQGILESMMSQLMSKEVLYEPLKELHDKVSESSKIIHLW